MITIAHKQESWLKKSLVKNSQCLYGLQYNFDTIETVADFQAQVPLTTYEDIAPYIARVDSGEEDVLFMGKPIAFELTGGSKGGRKLIPYTKESFADFQRAILPWFVHTTQHYELSGKNIYLAISPALRKEQISKSGVRIGVQDEEYLGESLSHLGESSVVPKWVSSLEEISSWQLCTLYWLIKAKELELISIWSPTFLLMLLDALDSKIDTLLELFTHGDEVLGHTLEADAEALLRLKKYITHKDTAILWPHIKLISCWADASSQFYFQILQKHFKHVNFQAKGVIATETVVTIPNELGKPSLALQSAFYEFLQKNGKIVLAHELNVGDSYELVVTTNGGLYRYKTEDIFTCESCNEEEVILRFQGRSGISSDLVGEKLTETFVLDSLQQINAPSLLSASPCGYILFLEQEPSKETQQIIQNLEKNLSKNPQYAYAREMGQLKELELFHVKSLSKCYLEYKAKRGFRMGDIKVPSLCTDQEFYHSMQKELL